MAFEVIVQVGFDQLRLVPEQPVPAEEFKFNAPSAPVPRSALTSFTLAPLPGPPEMTRLPAGVIVPALNPPALGVSAVPVSEVCVASVVAVMVWVPKAVSLNQKSFSPPTNVTKVTAPTPVGAPPVPPVSALASGALL